jgi:membrane associated rhomboid family serine protease
VIDLATPASALIFAVTIAISLIALFRDPRIMERFVMRPYLVARGRHLETVVTSGFLHGDLGHLLFNMFTFYFFAFDLDRYLGSVRFSVLYVAGLILSSVCSIRKHRDNAGYATLGASGAISAVLFAYIVYFPTTTLILFPIPFPIPAALFAVGYVAYSWWAARESRGRINHDAHLCGAISGLGFVAVTDPAAFSRLAEML